MDLDKIVASREIEDAKRFHNLDWDLCQLCGAYGDDKRSLKIECFYDVSEVIPEAIDCRQVGGHDGWFLRLCKSCRGDLLGLLGDWRSNRVDLRGIPKDHDGNIYEEDESKDIPVRVNGAIKMMSLDEFEVQKEKNHEQ